MERTAAVVLLLVLLPCAIHASQFSTAKLFGIAGITCGIAAISADLLTEHYYSNYRDATDPDECSRLRERITICERVRDIGFGLAVVNFSVSTILWIREKNEVGVEIGYKDSHLCLGLIKKF
jgi:hypothetical protein